MQQLHRYIMAGWPANISSVPLSLRAFWNLRNDLHIAENLILLNNRIVIPATMRAYVLKCIHQGHMGIEKSKARARASVYWPAMYSDIERDVLCVINTPMQIKRNLCYHTLSPHIPGKKLELTFLL